jgi:hypothetical protein
MFLIGKSCYDYLANLSQTAICGYNLREFRVERFYKRCELPPRPKNQNMYHYVITFQHDRNLLNQVLHTNERLNGG